MSFPMTVFALGASSFLMLHAPALASSALAMNDDGPKIPELKLDLSRPTQQVEAELKKPPAKPVVPLPTPRDVVAKCRSRIDSAKTLSVMERHWWEATPSRFQPEVDRAVGHPERMLFRFERPNKFAIDSADVKIRCDGVSLVIAQRQLQVYFRLDAPAQLDIDTLYDRLDGLGRLYGKAGNLPAYSALVVASPDRPFLLRDFNPTEVRRFAEGVGLTESESDSPSVKSVLMAEAGDLSAIYIRMPKPFFVKVRDALAIADEELNKAPADAPVDENGSPSIARRVDVLSLKLNEPIDPSEFAFTPDPTWVEAPWPTEKIEKLPKQPRNDIRFRPVLQ